MISNALDIMVVTKDERQIIFDFWLGNEESAELTQDEPLFSDANTIEEIIGVIENSFLSLWDRDNYKLASFIDDFDYDGEYTKFTKNLKALSPNEIRLIVLMTNNQQDWDGSRKYQWIKYDFETGVVKKGEETGQPEDTRLIRWNPEGDEVLKLLIHR